ncbi:MAG: hypothetical protein J5710_08170 [Treponema sp.]|nr:hypothetical protein [Treponema sp.]
MGSFLAGSEKECKVGYSTDLQFSLKKNDYYFVSLEAVSTDETQTREDFVEFTLDEKASDLEKGIYIVKVKLLKAASDILIRPVCLELPGVTDFSPSAKSTQFANIPIVITFNIPVEAINTTYENTLFNYPNISLVYTDSLGNEKPMTEFFDAPKFNNDKTVLTIKPKASELKQFIIEENIDYVDLRISFSEVITVQVGDYLLPLKKDSNFTVRYSANIELTEPECKAFFVTKEPIKLSDVSTVSDEQKLILDKKEKLLDDDELVRNIIPATIYIYGKYYDKDSGVKSIEIDEKHIYSATSGSSKNATEIKTTYTTESKNIECESDENGYTSFILQYSLQELLKEEPGDGEFSLGITVKDACGNSAEQKVLYVINLDNYQFNWYQIWEQKNSSYQYVEKQNGNAFSVYNTPFSKANENSGSYDFSKYNSDIKRIRIKDENKEHPVLIELSFIRTHKYSCKDIVFYCEYDKNGEIIKKTFSDYDETVMERYYDLPIDKVNNVSFSIVAEYQGAVIGRKKYSFPSEVQLSSINTNSVNIYSDSTVSGYFKIQKSSDGSYSFSDTNSDSVSLASGYSYYVGYKSKDSLYGEVIGPFVQNQTAVSNISAPVSELPVISKSKKGFLDATLKFPADLWSNYDEILIDCYKGNDKKETKRINSNDTQINNNKVYCTLSLDESMYFYDKGKISSAKIKLTGLKNKVRSSTGDDLTIQLTAAQLLEFDDIKPNILECTEGMTSDGKVVYSFYDNGSGPESGEIYINGVFYDYMQEDSTKQNTFKIEIPFKSFNYSKNTISYNLKDKKGNVTNGNLTINPAAYSWGFGSFTCSDSTLSVNSNSINGSLQVFKYDFTYKKWELIKTIANPTSSTTVSVDSGNFYRAFGRFNPTSIYDSVLYAATIDSGNSEYNYVSLNGMSTTSIVISSKANVLVRIFETKQSFDECKKWSAAEWNILSDKCRDSKMVSFSSTSSPKMYTFDDVYISEGNCYCAVVYFANGYAVPSQVFVK